VRASAHVELLTAAAVLRPLTPRRRLRRRPLHGLPAVLADHDPTPRV